MKYMGSKRSMLQNGLGSLILEQSEDAQRIVDLFCGSSSVAWFAAEKTKRPVLAVDLQSYGTALAEAVIGRTKALEPKVLARIWLARVERARSQSRHWKNSKELAKRAKSIKDWVHRARRLCARSQTGGPIWSAYGGYYFSPEQSLTFDLAIRHLPRKDPHRSTCLAALIDAAMKCAAAPGHTAQPFRPTKTARRFLKEAWSRDPIAESLKALKTICPKHANVQGSAIVGNALEIASQLRPTDLAIVDPPYSGVQYSRFYHVLETIARGVCGTVSGAGRYPEIKERPQSQFCNKGTSRKALAELMSSLASTGASVIFTFPAGKCSNFLSGDIVLRAAKRHFDVQKMAIKGRFSTLGGNNAHRASRQASRELVLLLHPRKGSPTEAAQLPSQAPQELLRNSQLEIIHRASTALNLTAHCSKRG